MIEGIVDLSHWQSPVHFGAFKNDGGLAVILKATQGSRWVDTTFTRRFVQAIQAGLLVGAYHFCDGSDPAAQVANFMRIAGTAVKMLAIDVEPNEMGVTVSVPQAAEIVARLQILTGRLPLVYIGRYGPTKDGAGLPNGILKRCPLWLPEYGTDPICPLGWDDWTFWQYTEKGMVMGVQSPCDRNRFAGDEAELEAWWNA